MGAVRIILRCCLLGIPAMAAAQTVPGTAAGDTAAAAASVEAPAPADALGDIVVTAQRREERLQDVPLSVAAINSAQLAASGITNVQSLGQVVPSLSVSNAVGFTITTLRGVGSTAIGPGLEPPVSIYLDGVYYASTTSSLFDFSNIERVEVLKGPQGTLFGRNATGGLIQVITRDPGPDLRVTAHVGYANYQTVSGDAYIAGGLASNLFADLSVIASGAGDGWGRNITTGQDTYRNLHNVTVRSKLVWQPGDRTKFTLIGDYTNYRNSLNGQRAPKGSLTLPALGPTPVLDDEYDQAGNINPLARNHNEGVSLKAAQDVGFATLSNLVAYRNSKTQLRFDIDFTPVAQLDGRGLIDREKQFSDELQLSSKGGGPFSWQAGLFYFWARGAYDPSGVEFNNAATSPVAPLNGLDSFGVQKTESIAGYAQGTYEFLPETKLTLGARYTYEKRTIDGFTIGYLPGRVSVGQLGPASDDSLTFKKPTFRVALDHRFSPELLAYASFNTGFKSGGFNTQSTGDPSFRPETIDAYEVGFKSDLLGRRLRVNLAGFYYDYSDIQVQKVGVATTGIINGAAAEIYGVDLDFAAAVTDRFTLTGNAAYTHGRFTDFIGAPFGPPLGTFAPNQPGDASGNRLIKTPTFQATLAANYRADLASGASLAFNLLGSYNAGYFLEADNINRQRRFAKANASVTWTSPSKAYSVRLFANNLTDQRTQNYNSTLADGSRNASYEAPRTYGITLGFRLGN